ncbi:Zinc finger CCCH-type [Penicillium maclennaniae]|uniref:Zinc finger CCCH-type n=1 Tax=Penicillium maclennaniae TaxID=1343394 RepID=UPI00253FAB3B|nr:Zinc finger CCCH-type [Penicillium maclennaniae]KAJ5668543.1 Zinc finger CCCH-type [Penicillium maclennaniae]
MEQSSAQNPLQGLPHGTGHESIPPDYWNSLDPIYDPQLQLQQPQGQSTQAPMGMTWDHHIFQNPQQSQSQQQQQRQQSHLAPTESNHALYIPESWQANPLQAPARGYSVSSQYQSHQQAPVSHSQHTPQYHQDQMTFDSRAMTNATESSTFPSLNYQQYYPQDSFSGRPPQQQSQHTISQFPISSGFPQASYSIDLTDDFSNLQPRVQQHIDPGAVFPNPDPQISRPPSHIQPSSLYGAPEFQHAEREAFDFYQNGLSLQQPQFGTTPVNAGPTSGYNRATGLPQPEVVITAKKSTKKPAAKKTGPKTQKKVQNQADSDSSDDSKLEIEAPDEASPLPPNRPSDPVEAGIYDSMKAVWSPRNKWPSADKVKGALVAFKDVIKVLRDAWKDQVQAMKLAENQGDNAKAAQLKESVALQRRIMDKIVDTALTVGHPTIVEKLGEHPLALSIFYSFLVDRFQAADFEGSLTVNILKLLVRFVTVDEELLQKTNIAKLLPRFIKKGGPSVKELAQKIQENAVASTKRKQQSGKEDPSSKGSGADSPSAELAGAKRPREGESNHPPATKRMVVGSNAGKPSTAANGLTKAGALNGKPVNAAAPRPRANIVAPKPSSLFGALSSASKRPGTTNAERAAAQAAAKPADNQEKPAPPPPKPAFSFGDIMADLSKPKEVVVAKPAEDRPPETEEEREKRLRKEARRKLRVTWKSDDSLTEVRLFTHDPDEELGPGDGSMRGMGDVKGEGSVLKLHKDMDELEEEDLGGIRETTLNEYSGLSEVIIESEEQKSANFIKRGGEQQPSSPEKAAQEHRESTTLMVFYTSPADVPPSPKEPPAPEAEEIVLEEVPFGEVPDHIKARQERYFSYMNPKPATPAAAPGQPNAAPAGTFDISNLLKMIHTGQQSQSTPPPQPQQPPMSDLERTISMFRQQQTQPVMQPPQIPITQTAPQAPVAGGVDFAQILNVMKQFQNPAAAFAQPQQTQASMAPNLGAMFTQFAGQNQQQAGGPQDLNSFEDPERKRMRETSQYEDSWSRGKRTKQGDSKPYKVGLVPCRFWAEGKCRKGENCTFRHDS